MASESLLAVQKLFADAVKTKGHQQAVRMVIDLVECCGLAFPLEKPKSATEEETAAAIARCFDADWWRRQIRRLQDQVIEHVHITIGLVNKRKGVYASNFTVGRKQAQWQRNTKTLSMLIATNDLGEQFTLLELAKKSISNLANRRAELMTRLAGIEAIAKDRGHVGIFYTITAPSHYHACLSTTSAPNPKYSGASPADTQAYFNTLWQRTRAKLHRQGLHPYGFRVVEPHQDGTPHWHLLLFIPKDQATALSRTLREYAFAEQGNEPGAFLHRFKVEHIDPKIGTAAGYIAKYISKNIDGQNVGEDQYGFDAVTSAVRIRSYDDFWCMS